MKTYQNQKWNLSPGYPDDWEVVWENEPDGGWEIVVGMAGQPSRSGRPLVTIRVLKHALLNFHPSNVVATAAGGTDAPMRLPRDPGEYNEGCKRELVNVLPGLRFLSEKTGTLAGMPSGTLLYSYRANSGGIRETQVNLFGSAVTYRLMCEAPEEQSQAVEGYFDCVLASFTPFVG